MQAKLMGKKLTTEEFIKKAKEIHGDRYDYSKVNYVASETKICIICPKHGEFWQTPHRHLRGDNCPLCSSRARLTIEQFIERSKEVHGDKYDYSKVNYVDNETPVCVICPEHGEFYQRPAIHFYGNGCPICGSMRTAQKRRKNSEKFIEDAIEIHGNQYNYDKVNYIDCTTPIIITCPKHGDFEQKPSKHLSGHGCPLCGTIFNIKELQYFNKLKKEFKNVEYQKNFPFFCEGSGVQKLDFYISEYNVGIEYHGIQHFEPRKKFGGEAAFKLQQERDIKKYNKCKKEGIKIFYLTEPSYKKKVQNYFEKVYFSLEELINAIKSK